MATTDAEQKGETRMVKPSKTASDLKAEIEGQLRALWRLLMPRKGS